VDDGGGSRGRPARDQRPGWMDVTSLVAATISLIFEFCLMAGITGPLRVGSALAFVVTVPGWTILGYARSKDALLMLSLAIGVSLTVVMLVAQVMMSVHYWHAVRMFEWSTLLCIGGLVIQVFPALQRRRHRGET
jgi:hypothetical protein